jgi:dTDP-4-dehydrorhamnose 3,5-epimerase
MNLKETKIDGLVLLKSTLLVDKRGYFTETFNQNIVNKLFGKINFVQDNESISSRGVLRGLHFQKPPYAQTKLVRCIKGTVLDIALDIRNNSKTYGKFVSTILSEDNHEQLFIPKGFAHGFIVLSDYAKLSYKVDSYYNSKSESGIIWNDQDLNIDWKINKDEIIFSEKDAKLKSFKNFISPF